MYLSKYVRPIVITLAIAVLSASHPAYSQECEAYPWNARKSVRGGCTKPGARCTVPGSTRSLGKCKTKFVSNPYERECDCAGVPLQRSATGEDVKRLQMSLNVAVDGKFGKKTEAAVRDFQEEHNLTRDGKVGPRTWAALNVVAAPTSK
jgi:peptidoglycan hydrolase-like protein with peptidoglycan-binding domain